MSPIRRRAIRPAADNSLRHGLRGTDGYWEPGPAQPASAQSLTAFGTGERVSPRKERAGAGARSRVGMMGVSNSVPSIFLPIGIWKGEK
jgi:hypothetical protein